MQGENDDYSFLPEQLLRNFPSKCYFADYFPRAVSDVYAEKYAQIEREIYDTICKRMYRALLKLWVYDDIYIESELLYSRKMIKKKIIGRRVLKEMMSNYIKKEKNLKWLMQLSRKNVIDLALAFEKLHMVMVPSWSCFFLFIEDDSSVPFIKSVLNTEGLYLRNAYTSEHDTENDSGEMKR